MIRRNFLCLSIFTFTILLSCATYSPAIANVPPVDISVTVTGIPEEYHGTLGVLQFFDGAVMSKGNLLSTGGCIQLGRITETWTFYMNIGSNGRPGLPQFNTAGNYAVLLAFADISDLQNVTTAGEYSVMRNIIAGVNEIPFSAFNPYVRN